MTEKDIENKLSKVAVFGPHDRMNYGDFLFPLMLDYAFSKKLGKEISFSKYSIVSSDFSSIGAFSSKKYIKLAQDIEDGKINTIIVAGGESLNVDWDTLYRFINPLYNFIRLNGGRVGKFLLDFQFARKQLGGKTEYPFCISKEEFQDIKIIYNSVGGFKRFNSSQVKNLEASDYFAVRDLQTFKNTEVLSKESNLVPDSAVILSDVFPKEKLNSSYKQAKPYLFFQVSIVYHQDKFEEIGKQLDDLATSFNLTIVLCPIGTALRHEDDVALKMLSKFIKSSSILIEKPNLTDIAFLIANAEIYLGTSLHGVITAMNYAVPYIGLNKRQTKVSSYLASWSIDELQYLCDLHDFQGSAVELLTNPNLPAIRKHILHRNEENKVKYYDSVNKMFDVLCN